MVQAIINLGEYEDRIVTIVKGKYGLKNKSDAINKIIEEFDDRLLESQLRPEYLKKLQKIRKEKGISFKGMKELRDKLE